MSTQEFSKAVFEADPFPNLIGINVKNVSPGYAEGEIAIDERFTNVIGSVHGGVIFTLADTVCGNASASYHIPMTTIDARVDFLRAAIRPEKLYAKAREIKHGRNICFYQVEITDDRDRLIARGQYTFYALAGKSDILPDDPGAKKD